MLALPLPTLIITYSYLVEGANGWTENVSYQYKVRLFCRTSFQVLPIL